MMAESTVLPLMTTDIKDNVSHLDYNGTMARTERFVDYDADVIGLIAMMSSFSVIGIPSNLLLVVVFRRRKIQQTGITNLFALSLAVIDTIICGLTVPVITCSNLGMIRSDFGCSVALYITHTTVAFQVILMLGVCIERYCAVCRPFQRWHIKHVIVFVSAAAVYSGSISALAFPSTVFDDTAFRFCERKACLSRNAMYALQAVSWLAIVILMVVLYTITVFKMYKRTTMKQKMQDTTLSNRAEASTTVSMAEFETTPLPPASNTRDAVFTVARTSLSPILDLALFAQMRPHSAGKSHSQKHSSRDQKSSRRITLLFVAITSILMLSWVPYWLNIFAETYVGLIFGNLVYVNNCTNFLVFAMNPTLRQEMALVIKRLICCRIRRA